MPIAIGIIMFGIGLNLRFKDFMRVFLHPKAIIIGLICQLVLLPIIAFILVYFWNMPPIYKVGFIIIASAPGGTASGLVTHLLNGRVALCVSLAAFNSIAIIFTIPVLVNIALALFLGEESNITLSFADTFGDILLTVILPVIGGILVNQYIHSDFTDKLKKPLKILLPAILASVMALAIFAGETSQVPALLDNIGLFFPLLVLNLSTMVFGYYIPKMLGLSHESNFTISIEVGLQNSALAIYIASSLLHSDEMALVAVIYGSFSFFTTFIIGWLLSKFGARKVN